jgi:anti-anti-sigma factor
MSITITCPRGHVLHVEDKYAGRSGKCPHCHALVHVPKPGQVLEAEILAVVEPPGATTHSEQPGRQELAPGKPRSDSSPMPKHHSTSIYHHLAVWKHEDKVVVRFGDHRILDELTVKKIGDELLDVAAGAKCHHLIVNFTSVSGLSTLMLGKLLVLRKIMAAKGGRLILCEIAPEIECVFVETKLNQILEIMDTEEQALAACK